uniref:Uncharacterized protein n=1 Tax=Opuntia streptacantha TaxID=393608 RepID=A0A7C9EGD9_OPUST
MSKSKVSTRSIVEYSQVSKAPLSELLSGFPVADINTIATLPSDKRPSPISLCLQYASSSSLPTLARCFSDIFKVFPHFCVIISCMDRLPLYPLLGTSAAFSACRSKLEFTERICSASNFRWDFSPYLNP